MRPILPLLAALGLAAAVNAQTFENPVKKLLKEGKPVICATITTPSVDAAVLAAQMGFDFLWIEMEHSPITLETARNMILATRGLKAVPFVRVPVNELWTAKRALDIGALGVMFPFTSTPELAKQAADATHYPSAGGRRGYGPRLAEMRWPVNDYASFANDQIATVIIIEEGRAIDKIDEIAQTKGIDVLFIGTSDLSYSLGYGGQVKHPVVKAAIDKVLAAGKKYGVPVGRPIRSAEDAKEAIDDGFRFLQGMADMVFLQNGIKQLLDPMGRTIDPKSKATY
jgi:2-keto-3-deoxy-L-rhamnonate aldolase RhmA